MARFRILGLLFSATEEDVQELIEKDDRVRNSLWLEALFNKELILEDLQKFPEDQIRLACGFARDYGYLFEPNPDLLNLCRKDDRADQRYLRKFFEMVRWLAEHDGQSQGIMAGENVQWSGTHH